jgi:hypothetical protein
LEGITNEERQVDWSFLNFENPGAISETYGILRVESLIF